MVIAGEGFSVPLAGEWRAKIEETWEGARRREILPTVPIAQQFLLANSPVADLFKLPPPRSKALRRAAGRGGAGRARRPPAARHHPRRCGARRCSPDAGGHALGDRRRDEVRSDDHHRPAGQRVEITFNNTDDMPHNVVIFKRGSMATYEKELFGSMNEPNAQLRGFVPDSPNVLVRVAAPERQGVDGARLRRADRAGRVPVRVLVPGTLGDDAGGVESRVKSARGDVR